MELYANKQFPDNYSDKVLAILRALSMTDLKHLSLHGSSSIRSQLYVADYDGFEKVNTKTTETIASKLKDIVKKVRSIDECYLGDIKCGEVPEWNVFRKSARIKDKKIINFNKTESQSVIDRLQQQKILSPAEANECHYLLEKANTLMGFLDAKKKIRFFVLRWKPQDILNGFLDYRHHRFNLEDAIESGGMIKIDAIANVYDRFTEFSVIYDVFMKGKRITDAPSPIISSLEEDILYYSQTNPFKALKRTFALSKVSRKHDIAAVCVDILNSDLGRLYVIISDLKTLRDLLDRSNVPLKEIKAQIDDMKDRMGNIYLLKDFLKQEHQIIGSVESILKAPSTSMKGKLDRLINILMVILNDGTLKILYQYRNKLKN